MDSVELNKGMGRVGVDVSGIAQAWKTDEAKTIRLECLKCAVAGPSAGHNEAAVLKRALAFERFVTTGATVDPGETKAWTGDELMEEGMKRAVAQLQSAPV